MNYSNNKAIYLQIADSISDRILTGELSPGEKVPSVRELGVIYEVNVNTALRAIEYLSTSGIIYNQRGIGYFVNEDAKNKIKDIRRKSFLKGEIKYFFKQLSLLDVTPEKLSEIYKEYINNQEKKSVL